MVDPRADTNALLSTNEDEASRGVRVKELKIDDATSESQEPICSEAIVSNAGRV